MNVCPACNSETGMRQIFYGYPAEWPVDAEKYSIGGCCVSDNDATQKCLECGWKGEYVNNMGEMAKFMEVVTLPDISQMADDEIDTYAKQIWQRLAKPKQGSDDGNSKE